MYLDVKGEICCLMIFSFCIYIQFLVVLWPGGGPCLGRNWSPFNKHIHESVLVVTGEILDLCD